MALQRTLIKHGGERDAAERQDRIACTQHFEEFVGGNLPNLARPFRRQFQRIEHCARAQGPIQRARGGDLLAAHRGCRMKKPSRCRHGQQGGDLRSAARLTKHHDSIVVAAKFRDVVAHPLQGKYQIQLPGVSRVGKLRSAKTREIEITKSIETMVYRDDYYIAAAAQTHAVIEWARSRSVVVSAAVNVEHHRTLAPVAQAWSPHVEEETVFTLLFA